MSKFKNVSQIRQCCFRYVNYFVENGWELLEIVQVYEELVLYIVGWMKDGKPTLTDWDEFEKCHRDSVDDLIRKKEARKS
jgi:hypothetical protein